MTNSTTFGRSAHTTRAKAGNAAVPKAAAIEAAPRVQSADLSARPADDEPDAWRKERRRAWRPPWRQMLLVGSLSFFIASFVLPASVNGAVDRVLDVLSVAGFLAWFAGRSKEPRGVSKES